MAFILLVSGLQAQAAEGKLYGGIDANYQTMNFEARSGQPQTSGVANTGSFSETFNSITKL